MDVASQNKLDDVITRTKFSSLRWITDNLVRSDDEKYLIASITKFISQETKLWFVPLSKSPNSIVENPNWSKLIVNLDFVYEFITSEDDLFYLRTNSQAENVRLITMNTKTNEIKEIISEDKNEIRRSTYQLCTYKYRETKSNIFTKIKTEILKYGIQQFDNNLIFYLKLIVQYMI
ncbi:unnamed protein product [Rotaria socialis]